MPLSWLNPNTGLPDNGLLRGWIGHCETNRLEYSCNVAAIFVFRNKQFEVNAFQDFKLQIPQESRWYLYSFLEIPVIKEPLALLVKDAYLLIVFDSQDYG
jgi:hypothetical protein